MMSTKADEQYDVVDFSDVPTGETIARGVIHDTPTPHRIAAVYVFDDDGKLYVQVHKKSGGLLDHTVGGHVDEGETYHEAAVREMREEIGLHVPLELVAESVLEDCREVGRANLVHFHGVFKAKAPRGWVFQPNDEVDELLLMTVDDIVVDMSANPHKYTYGFIQTMQAYRAASL